VRGVKRKAPFKRLGSSKVEKRCSSVVRPINSRRVSRGNRDWARDLPQPSDLVSVSPRLTIFRTGKKIAA